MFKRMSAVSLGVALVAGCSVSPSLLRTTSQEGLNAKSLKTVKTSDALEQTMKVLTGKEALPDGTLLSERASAGSRAKIRQYLSDALTQYGVSVERQAYRTGENLLGKLPAAVPSDEYILLGAHFDTVRTAGADDNASGTAAVLEAARLLAALPDRKVNVYIAFFDEEERGLLGSSFMAKELKRQGIKLLSAHTLDMVGWDGDKDGKIEVERPDGNLWDAYQQSKVRHDLAMPLARTNSGSTDHDSFRAAGFPSVGLCEEWAGGDTTPHYHRPTDTFETVNLPYLASVTKLLVSTVGDLARKTPVQASRVLPHDRFPGRDRTFLP